MGVALIPIVEMQSHTSRQHRQQTLLEERLLAQRNAFVMLGNVNVMEEPSGRRSLADGSTLSWTSAPISAPSRSLRFLGGEGDFDVRLFEIRSKVVGDGRVLATFKVEQLGWRRVTER